MGFGGIGGTPNSDDTADDPAASSGADAAAAAAGFDVDEVDMAAEMSVDDVPGGGGEDGDEGDAPGDPGGGAGADSEASGDPDSDSGEDPEGSDTGGGSDDGGGGGGGGDDGGGGGDDDEGDEWHLGGLLTGTGPKDITAHGGEYIIRKSAVKKYGRGLFDDLNKSKIGKRQLKGLLNA